jgi:hypothetical protein
MIGFSGGTKMKRLTFCTMVLCIAAMGVILFNGFARSQDSAPRMTKEDLKPLIGSPDVVVIDVRSMGDWNKETLMIKGAVREDPTNVASWIDRYPKDKTLIFYCS